MGELVYNDKKSDVKITKGELEEFKKEVQEAADLDNDIYLPIRTKGPITSKVMEDFANHVINAQASAKKKAIKTSYENDPSAYLNSGANRSRLVIIEDKAQSASALAEMIVNTSNNERVLIVGLDETQQTDLVEELKTKRKKEVESLLKGKSPQKKKDYLNKYAAHFNIYDNPLTIEKVIDQLELRQLMGPHIFQNDIDISPYSLGQKFPQIDTNLEEMICFGHSSKLSEDIVKLANIGQKRLPYLSIYSNPKNYDKTSEQGLWRYQCKDSNSFLGKVAAGKTSQELLSEENVELSKPFNDAYTKITLDSLYGTKNDQTTDSEEKKQNFEASKEKIFQFATKQALYEENKTPNTIATSIGKGGSWLAAKGGRAVGNALKFNMIDMPIATARGVDYGIANNNMDGGFDILREHLQSKVQSSALVDIIMEAGFERGGTPAEVVQFALSSAITANLNAEKDPQIKKILGEADKKRALSVIFANKVKKTNDLGVRLLLPKPVLYGLGITALAVGTAAFFTPLGPIVGGVLFGAGLMQFGTHTSLNAVSTFFQTLANKYHLARTSYASARANEKKNEAHDLIKTMFVAEAERIIAEDLPKAGFKNYKEPVKMVEISAAELARLQQQNTIIEANPQLAKPFEDFINNQEESKKENAQLAQEMVQKADEAQKSNSNSQMNSVSKEQFERELYECDKLNYKINQLKNGSKINTSDFRKNWKPINKSEINEESYEVLQQRSNRLKIKFKEEVKSKKEESRKGHNNTSDQPSSSEGSITPYSSFSDDDKKVKKRRHRRPTKKNSSLSSFSDGDSSQSQLHKPSKKPLSDLTMPNSDWNTASPIGSNTEVKTVTQYKINPPPQIEDNIKLGGLAVCGNTRSDSRRSKQTKSNNRSKNTRTTSSKRSSQIR